MRYVGRGAFIDRDAALASLICRRIPAQTPALQLLTHYAGILDNEQALSTPELQHQIATHIQDLIALTLGANARCD